MGIEMGIKKPPKGLDREENLSVRPLTIPVKR
jgi:hypothetical protein